MKRIALSIVLICPLFVTGQTCKKLTPVYKINVNNELSPFDVRRDSLLRSSNQVTLHLREDIKGRYEMILNDSVYYVGQIESNPYSGWSKQSFNLPIRPGINTLRLRNLETGTELSLKINTKYTNLILAPLGKCRVTVTFSNTSPFYG